MNFKINLSNTPPAQINLSGETGDALSCARGFGPLSSCSSLLMGLAPSPPAPLCSWIWPLSSCSSLLVGLAPLLLFLFARGFGPSPPAPLHGLKTDSISLSPPSTSMSMWSPPMKQKAVNDGVFP